MQEAFVAVQAVLDKAVVNLNELYILFPVACLCNSWLFQQSAEAVLYKYIQSIYTEYPSPQAELNLTLVQCVKISKDVALWKTVCFIKVFCPKFSLFSRESYFYFPYGLGAVGECFSKKSPCELGELLSLWVQTFHKVGPQI